LADRLEIALPDDFHAHLRQVPGMAAYARREALSFGRVLVMPNTLPPVASAHGLAAYRGEIEAALAGAPGGGFTPLMSFKLLPGMRAETVFSCAGAGAIAGKYYPAGSTTNAADGLREPAEAREALDAMEEAGLVLCVHAEAPEAPVLEREEAFIPVLEALLSSHPRLRLVIEHVSSAALLDFALAAPERVAATVTAHHLLLTLDDLLGEGLEPHVYCKPVLKPARDRDALREAVFRGEGRLFFGSDSAPHARAAKEGRRAAAGIYSSPTALPALAELFDSAGVLDGLEDFVAARGAAFYGLSPSSGRLLLERREWQVPEEVDGVVPMLAGRRLGWVCSRAARCATS
jgi:dihydroorotase